MPKAVTSMVYLSHWCASIHPPKGIKRKYKYASDSILDARLQVQVYLLRYTFQAPGQLAYMSENWEIALCHIRSTGGQHTMISFSG